MAKTKTETKDKPITLKDLAARWGHKLADLEKLVKTLKREDAAPLIRGLGVDVGTLEGDGPLLDGVLTAFAGLDFDFVTRITFLRNLTGDEYAASVAHSIVKRQDRKSVV